MQLVRSIARKLGLELMAWVVFAAGLQAAALAQDAAGPSGGGMTSEEPLGALPDRDEAAIEVVVGPAGKDRAAVAVPKARCSGPKETCNEVVAVVRHDLELTGFFKLLDPASFIAPADEPLDKPSFNDWNNVGARYLVAVQVDGSDAGAKLAFRLFDVVGRQRLETKADNPGEVPRRGVRRAAHEFVNAVLERLTGKRGVFGTRIVYARKVAPWRRAIYVMDSDGAGAHAVISNERNNLLPSFAGDAIVYTSQADDEPPQIWVGSRQLTRPPGRYRRAVLGPGGIYAVSVDLGSGSDIWTMDRHGKLLHNLTGGRGDNVSPSWSPDGKLIAFVSNRSGTPQIYVMNADGSNQRRLTMAGAYNTTPEFGPDGRIVFAGLDGGASDIFIVDLEGNITRLTQDQGWNKDPTWSPDGRWIAFVSSRNGGRIWVMTADGRWQFPLSRKAGAYSTPFWEKR